jgi:hypothetical protein
MTSCPRPPRLVYFDRSAWADLVRDQDAGGDATNRLLRAVTSNRVKIAIQGVVKMPKDLMRDEALAARDGKGRPTSFRRIPGWMAQSGVLDGLYVVKTDHRRHGGGPQKEDEAGTHFQKGVLHIRHIRDRALELLQ